MKKNRKDINQYIHQSGQALVIVLVIMTIAFTIIPAAITLIGTSSLSASRFEVGDMALVAAESGVEDALSRLIRDPKSSNVSLPFGADMVDVVTVFDPSSNDFTIISTARFYNISRKIFVRGNYPDRLVVLEWKERD